MTYAEEIAREFMENETELIDISGVYGPQSVDLIVKFVRQLSGTKWAGPTQHARDLMIAPGLRIWFDEIEPHQLRFGDIVVLHGFDTSDFGTTGIFIDGGAHSVNVFTQTPMKPSAVIFERLSVVGGLRYKYTHPIRETNTVAEPYLLDEPAPVSCTLHSNCVTGEERKLNIWTPASDEPSPLREQLLKGQPQKRAVLGEFMQGFDVDGTTYTPKTDSELTDGEWCVKQYDKWAAQHVSKLVADAAKPSAIFNFDEVNQPGDIIVWDSDVISQYGHVAIVQNAPAPWWRRVTNWLGITRPKTIVAVQQDWKEDK